MANGLLKHLRCNQARGGRRASGCDQVWLEVVSAKLETRPVSFKANFRKPKSREPGQVLGEMSKVPPEQPTSK